MQLELEPRQHSVSIEGRTTLVSVRMSQIVQMMEENNRELAEEEGENPDDIILTLQDVIDFVVAYEYDHNDEDTVEMINLGIDLLHMKGIYFSRELVEEDKYGYIGGHAQMRQDSIVSQPVIKDTSFRGF
mgnify:FL=1